MRVLRRYRWAWGCMIGMAIVLGLRTLALLPGWGGGALLHHCAGRGWTLGVRLFCAVGVSPDLRDAQGYTPLHWAARAGRTDTARLLLAFAADPYAAGEGHDETPLHLAAAYGQVDILRLLRAQGAEIDTPDALLNTPLCEAALAGHPATVTYLLAHGARPSITNIEGNTPLHLAVSRERTVVVHQLIAAGADPHLRNVISETPFTIAVFMNRYDLAQICARGVSAEELGMGLQRAVNFNSLDGVRWLLARDADVRRPSNLVQTAVRKGSLPMVQFLLTHGADINARDRWRRTPLHYAWRDPSPEMRRIARWLEAHGAGCDLEDCTGRTPREYARAYRAHEPDT